MSLSEAVSQSLVELSALSGTTELVVCLGDNEIFRYSDPDATSVVDVYAVQKGLLALLISVAEEKYLLETCDAINHHLPPEWTGLSPWHEASVTIETLLTMTTGMDEMLAPHGKVGETWFYNNTAYQFLKKILCLHTGLSLDALSREWLFEPLGMSETCWVERETSMPDGAPYTGLISTGADMVKLGRLVLNKGRIGDQQLIPEYFIETMSQPGSEENPAWGLSWWNNYSDHYMYPPAKRVEGPIISGAPADLVAARGLYENGLYIVPSLDLVVARTAARKSPEQKFEREFWALLMKGLSGAGTGLKRV